MMKTQLFDPTIHNRDQFKCGVDSIDDFLVKYANQNQKFNNSRTYVMTNPGDDSEIIGFYTLMLNTFDFEELPSPHGRQHAIAKGAILISKLAVDKRYHRQGVGEALLLDALTKSLSTSDIVGVPIVLIDALPEAVNFYTQYGFEPLNNSPTKLFIAMKDVELNINGVEDVADVPPTRVHG